MPTYEYLCEKCKKVFEEFQSMSAEPLKVCKDPDCGGPVNRLLSGGAGFLFKGSGFYITDYRSDSYKKGAQSGDSSSSSSSSSTTTTPKTDSSSSSGSSASPSTPAKT